MPELFCWMLLSFFFLGGRGLVGGCGVVVIGALGVLKGGSEGGGGCGCGCGWNTLYEVEVEALGT